MSRRRSLNKVPTRMVGAAMPVDEADRIFELCARVGITQSEVVRSALYSFMAEHAHDGDDNQEVLPLRAAG